MTEPHPSAVRSAALPETIGLSLSGGGFRAAAFHLGTLAYLERVGLLSRVKMLSTVSGGTFTGAKYALSRSLDESFPVFYDRFRRELADGRVFPGILERVGDGGSPNWDPRRRCDFITAAADVYTERWFSNKLGDPVVLGDLGVGKNALEEATFNATDFSTGLAFRFQRSTTGGKNGNGRCSIDSADAAGIRLGDVAAASSCFPGGFEPLAFPDDFVLPEDVAARMEASMGGRRACLMDGGVYDNQGLESLLLADARRRKGGKPAADLFIVSDSDRATPELFAMPPTIVPAKAAKKASWLDYLLSFTSLGGDGALAALCEQNPRIGTLDALLQWGLLIGGVSAVLSLYHLLQMCAGNGVSGLFQWLLCCGLPLLALLGLLGTGLAVRRYVERSLLPLVPEMGKESWKHLRRIRIRDFLEMVSLRISSVRALTTDVFMKRIRGLGYAAIYGKPSLDGRIMANFVYHLGDAETKWPFAAAVPPAAAPEAVPSSSVPAGAEPAPLQDGSEGKARADAAMHATDAEQAAIREYVKGLRRPSEALLKTARAAAAVGTKLWFDSPEELPTLLAAGQATTCFNLMKYIARTRSFDLAAGRFAGPAGDLWEKLAADWDRFQESPTALPPQP